MVFATIEDLRNLLRDPSVPDATVQLNLDLATGDIRAETGQTFTLVSDDTVTFEGRTDRIVLPQRPVVSVGEVTGRWFGGETTTFALDVDYFVHRVGDGVTLVAASCWPDEVTVVYTHGYDTIPDDVRGACLVLAADRTENPNAYVAARIDDASFQTVVAGGKSQVDMVFDRLKRRYGSTTGSARMRAAT